MSRNHPYHKLLLPSDASLEFKPSPGKGWGAFATKPIKKGALILQETALFVILKHHDSITEYDLQVAYDRLNLTQRRSYLSLRDHNDKPFPTLELAFSENCFQTLPVGQGAYILHSRFNHSCVPNSKVPEVTGHVIKSFAMRDIEVGEEILFCYEAGFESKLAHDRHQRLRFVCHCKACVPGTLFYQLSALRRTLVRGLRYLTNGGDLDHHTGIITDVQLRISAETFAIPFGNRLFYLMLTMVMLEEEGLLDELLKARMEPGISFVAKAFTTESNVKIVKVAMAQMTWQGKMMVAMRLYGKKDAADEIMANFFRMKMQGLSMR